MQGMGPIVLLLLAAGAACVVALGWPRIRIPRSPGLGEIDDPLAAQAYDRISRMPQFRALRRMTVSKLSEQLLSGILADIGCGPGLLTSLIAQRYPELKVLGIDASDEMVKAATSNAAALGLSARLEFREGDILRLPLKDASLDVAVSTFSLHHWSDPGMALAEVHRVLKPGGRFLLFDLRRDARRAVYFLLLFARTFVVPRALRRAGEPLGSLKASYTLAEVEDLFQQSPFQRGEIDGGIAWLFAWGEKVPRPV